MIEATGKVLVTPRGHDLVLVRGFGLTLESLWGYVSDPALTATWFGPWRREPQQLRDENICITLKFEEGEPSAHAEILSCTAPTHLELVTQDEFGRWHLELFVASVGTNRSELRFVHHLGDAANVGEIGPGWEYYLDMLVAATQHAKRPAFDEYYPALSDYYLGQMRRGSESPGSD